MDLVSELIGSIRAGSANARRIKESGRWGLRFPGFAGMGFHVVVRGTGWLISPDRPPVEIVPGDVVLVPNGAEHGLSHDPRSTIAELETPEMGALPPRPGPADFEFLCGAYRLGHGQVHGYLRAMPEAVAIRPDPARQAELHQLIDLLRDDVAQNRPGTGATRSALIDLFLVHALREWQAGAEPWAADPGVAVALREIHARPEHAWTVGGLAQQAGMSRTAFSRRFAELVGRPPMAYLISWRLTSAARLLRETTAPLAAIARQVGYGSEFAFAGAFRREYGIAPGRFRDQNPHERARPVP